MMFVVYQVFHAIEVLFAKSCVDSKVGDSFSMLLQESIPYCHADSHGLNTMEKESLLPQSL